MLMYYFAYGTNMNYEHMRRIAGRHFTVLGVATLPDYEFGIDQRGYNNSRPKKGSKVWGVLYEVDDECIAALDNYEGYPEVFGRIEVTVTDFAGSQKKAWMYLQPSEAFGGTKAKEEHIKRILAGAEENHLPQEWIKFLETFR